MKEKIKKIHDKYVAPCEYGITSSDLDLVSQEIEHLVNQEVERRIAERMDETEAIFLEKWIRTFNLFSDTSAFCHGYRRMIEERDNLRSRLTSSEKPNNSPNDSQKQTHQDAPQVPYKTEGGDK